MLQVQAVSGSLGSTVLILFALLLLSRLMRDLDFHLLSIIGMFPAAFVKLLLNAVAS